MKVLVTGANGFLAANIIRELTSRGIQTKGMVRRNCNMKAIEGLNPEICYGNITSLQDVKDAVDGCDFVIHAAADTSQNTSDPSPLFPVNVQGTANVITASKDSKVKRLIFVSTANTSGLDKENPSVDKLAKHYKKSGYALSKSEAEQLIRNETKVGNLDAVIVNPTFMIGPYDAKPSSGRIFFLLLKKGIVFYPPGGKNFVDVRCAAVAICNAITLGQSGESYTLSGENMSFKEFAARLKQVANRPSVQIQIPASILIFAGILGSAARIIGIKAELNYHNAKILTLKEDISNKKAVDELRMPTTNINKSIVDAVSWLRKNGYFHW